MADDGQKAVFVGTFLTNGESVALCDEHMVYFCASTLQDMTGVDPAPFIAAISEEGDEGEAASEIELSEAELAEEVKLAETLSPLKQLGTFAEAEKATEETPDPTPPTPRRGRLRAVSSGPPTGGDSEQDVTIADAAAATPAT
jgi:hypothetical protein